MSLEEVYYVSQIVAVGAIIGSLVAIYLQQIQTNKIARAQITKGVTVDFQGTLRELMKPELATIYRKVMFEPAPLSPVESTQILIHFNSTLSSVRAAFHVERDSLIDLRLLDSMSQVGCWYLTAPVFAAEWRRTQRSGQWSQEFVAYVNGRFAKLYPSRDVTLLSPGAHEPHA